MKGILYLKICDKSCGNRNSKELTTKEYKGYCIL